MIDSATALDLLAAARAAMEHAYAPYSDFPVGAAVLTADGTIFTGCNIENTSVGLTCCAERTAVFAAVAAGHRTVHAVAVTAARVPSVSPCGACRQVLNEFKPTSGDLAVAMEGGDLPAIVPLAELLPMPFGPRDVP